MLGRGSHYVWTLLLIILTNHNTSLDIQHFSVATRGFEVGQLCVCVCVCVCVCERPMDTALSTVTQYVCVCVCVCPMDTVFTPVSPCSVCVSVCVCVFVCVCVPHGHIHHQRIHSECG